MAALSSLPEVVQLNLAVVHLPDSHPAAVDDTLVPVHGFCIKHPDGAILVDTGVGYGNDFIDEIYRPERVALGDALRAAGIALDDVVAVVNSHLHFDHCGQNNALFGSSVSFHAQQAELATVATEAHYTDRSWACCPTAQQREVRGDEEIADGVTILATPGHTVGHQSVLVEGGGRRLVIGGQLVWHATEYHAGVAAPANVDPVPELRLAAVDSIERVKALRPEAVYLSHCPAVA